MHTPENWREIKAFLDEQYLLQQMEDEIDEWFRHARRMGWIASGEYDRAEAAI